MRTGERIGAAPPSSSWLDPVGTAGLVDSRTFEVPIALLRAADSPRLKGADGGHTRLLAETDAELPPILVCRGTMRVIDGMHRLEAALMRGAETIRVRYVDGDPDAVFVLAVESNVRHGLPLTLADRKAAAARIVRSHPHWSDRAVAAKTGLAHKTVGAIRRRSSGEIPQLGERVGQDGRVRKVRVSAPAQLEDGRPGRTGEFGVSPDGGGPAGSETRSTEAQAQVRGRSVKMVSATADANAVLRLLSSDPSLRYTDAGRTVLRILQAHVCATDRWDQLAAAMPEHLLDLLAELMRKCIDDYHEFAAQLQRRSSP